MLKQRLYLNRPIYVGFTILDVSKTLMYDIHYNYITKTYGQCAKLLFTDTDSLCYNISTENIYEDMMRDIHLFDTSEYLVKKRFGPMIADQEQINGCVRFAFQLSPFLKPGCQK